MTRRLHFIAGLLPVVCLVLTACQAMTPGTFAAKNGGAVVSSDSSEKSPLEDTPPSPALDKTAPSSSEPLPSSPFPASKSPSGTSGDSPITYDGSKPEDSASPSGPMPLKSPVGPLAKADDPMSPKADLGDPLDGGDQPKDRKGYGCVLSHVQPSGEKVTAGVGTPYPPLAQPGMSSLNARFFAEILEAPADCLEAECWTRKPAKPGHHVQMTIYFKGVPYYQTAMVTDIGPDGANVELSGLTIQDGYEIKFSHIPLNELPFPAPALTAMTDAAWEGSGTDCDFGWFTVKTAQSYIPLRSPWRILRDLK